MAFIPEEIVEEIKARADIHEVVSAYVRFTKKSGANLFGLCPFHQEKTPSFSINSQKQIFYCFGCHKGGDAVRFIMDIESLNYPEALRLLADKYNIEIPEKENPEEKRSRSRRRRLYELNTEAARYFYRTFRSKEARHVTDYLSDRGIDLKTATSFGLGYSPDSWDGLLKHVRAKGYTESECAMSGLFRRNRKGGLYDLFRDRLIFPIIDTAGRIIGFGGRNLKQDETAKYINSPESPVYHKGEELYALNLAKRSHEDHLLLVEGYMDVLALHQAGFNQAIACLGTALTDAQAAKIQRYTDKIMLCFDADEAGRRATERSLDVVRRRNLEAYVPEIPDGLDPDDFIRRNGPERFRVLLDQALKGTDYLLKRAKEESLVHGSPDQLLYKDKVLNILKDLNDAVEIQLRINALASALMISPDVLNAELQRLRRRGPDRRGETGRPPRRAGATDRRKAAEDQRPDIADDPLAFTFYAILAHFTENGTECIPPEFDTEAFPKSHKPLAEKVLDAARKGELDARRLTEYAGSYRCGNTGADDRVAAQIMNIREPIGQGEAERALRDTLRRMKRERLQEERVEINMKLSFKQESLRPEELIPLELRLRELLEEERQLRRNE